MSVFRIDEGRLGKRVLANDPIPEGKVICRFEGKPITYEETLELDSNESYGLQVGPNLYICLNGPYCFFNHSCEPNCGLNGALELVSLRDISKNEELTYDYSTTMLERGWTMPCACRKESCRKTVTDFDMLPKDLQERYIRLGVVQPFILELLKDRKK